MQNIFAHTEPGQDYPAYISINRDDTVRQPGFRVSVRSAGNAGRNLGEIHVTPEMLEAMATDIIASINGEQSNAVASLDARYRAMVDRFLGWKLPNDFAPDAGISLNRTYTDNFGMPTGTNLLHAGQALEMFKHCVQLPAAPADYIAAAVDRINATIIVEGEAPEKFRERIAGRVADIGKDTFELPSGPVLHTPSGAVFDEVIAAAEPAGLVALTPQAEHQCCGKCEKPADSAKIDVLVDGKKPVDQLRDILEELARRLKFSEMVNAVLLSKAGGSVTLVDADGDAVIGKTMSSEVDAETNAITFRLVDAPVAANADVAA